jgi:hypothetical protein
MMDVMKEPDLESLRDLELEGLERLDVVYGSCILDTAVARR